MPLAMRSPSRGYRPRCAGTPAKSSPWPRPGSLRTWRGSSPRAGVARARPPPPEPLRHRRRLRPLWSQASASAPGWPCRKRQPQRPPPTSPGPSPWSSELGSPAPPRSACMPGRCWRTWATALGPRASPSQRPHGVSTVRGRRRPSPAGGPGKSSATPSMRPRPGRSQALATLSRSRVAGCRNSTASMSPMASRTARPSTARSAAARRARR
mmetsp:Transcript_119914/g.346480  ORF Transcript_119914/g.346480 Transcript_119914/m.346480 type:complete len:211 (-) Transcript_119914:215-847(-)